MKFWIVLCHKKTFEFLNSDLKVLDHVVSKKITFEFLDPDFKALDPRKLLKKDGYLHGKGKDEDES